jgi:hypothetical protein
MIRIERYMVWMIQRYSGRKYSDDIVEYLPKLTLIMPEKDWSDYR